MSNTEESKRNNIYVRLKKLKNGNYGIVLSQEEIELLIIKHKINKFYD